MKVGTSKPPVPIEVPDTDSNEEGDEPDEETSCTAIAVRADTGTHKLSILQ